MNTYVELKEKEKQLLEKIEKIKEENIELLSVLDGYKEEYSEDFTVIAKDLRNSEPEKVIYRLVVLQDDVKMSNNISEEDKQKISNMIDEIAEKCSEKDSEYRKIARENNKNTMELEKRKEYVVSKFEEIKAKEDKIEVLEQKKKFYENIIYNKFSEHAIIVEAKKILNGINIEKDLLEIEIENILTEPGLKEDLDIVNEELKLDEQPKEVNEESEQKELKTIKKEETVEKETTEEKTLETKEEKLEDTEKNITPELKLVNEKNDSETKEEENEEQDLEAVKPEKPHRVIFKKKASPELINKIKNGGKMTLGILAIGAAVAAIIVNPVALIAVPAGAVIYEKVKNKKK